MKKWNKKEIMREAWSLARHQAEVIGGEPREWLSYGLKYAWQDAKVDRQMESPSWLAGQERAERETFELYEKGNFSSKEKMAMALPATGNPIIIMIGT